MKFKLRPLTVAMLATVTALSGCSTEEEKIDAVDFTDEAQVNSVTGVIETAHSGMVCQLPDLVQVIDEDFYPLTQAEKDALRALVDTDGKWTEEQIAHWNSNDLSKDDTAYTYDYGATDLYATLGLTNEEKARQATAKEEARAFKISQGQDAIFNAEGAFEGGFDAWFEAWFASVPETDYLGASQRIPRATRGLELSLSSAHDDQELCYTPPTECPNYKIVDESGKFDCIVPEENPIDEAPAPIHVAGANEAVIYFKKADGDYTDISIHAWNNSNCTAYHEDSLTNWGTGLTAEAKVDPNYGMAWKLKLIEGHASCGNMIVYNKSSGDKFITNNDAMIPLGNSGDVVFHNLDKNAYFEEGFPSNFLDGVYLANQHPYFGASAASKSCGWGTELDDAGEACVGQVIESCPEGSMAVGVYVDATDPENSARQVDVASKCIPTFNPDETTLFLRGGFNGWGNPTEGHDFEYTGEGQYRKNFAYGEHEDETEETTVNHFFKVADEDWSEATTFGGIKGGGTPAIGSEIQVTAGNGVGQDMALAFEENSVYQFLFNASDVTNTKLKINKVPVDAFPVLSIDDTPYELTYTSDGVYTISKVALTAATYTLTIADTDADYAVGGASDATTLELDTPLAVVDGGDALTFVVEQDADYDFYLDYSDAANPVASVKLNVPYGSEKVYIRGTMTGWGDPAPAEDEMVYDADSRTYSVIYGLEADGNHNFKFASQAWGGALDLGGSEFDFSTDEDALTLSGDGNVVVTPENSTSYEFSISFAESKGVLKVREAPIYIRGGIYGTGDWAADETMRLNFEATDTDNTTEASHVYTSKVMTTGTGFFKIADEGWGGDNSFGFNYGASAAQETAGTNVIELGTPMKLTSGGDSKNISFQEPAGEYKFSFNDVTKELTVTSVE